MLKSKALLNPERSMRTYVHQIMPDWLERIKQTKDPESSPPYIAG